MLLDGVGGQKRRAECSVHGCRKLAMITVAGNSYAPIGSNYLVR
jgi:hypothetical protein